MSEATGTATIVAEVPHGGTWSPVEGQATGDLLLRMFPADPGARRELAEASRAILARCADPAGPRSSHAGLVIGYVQSGKTLSFTTVAALAKDNGYVMVVLIAGTSTYLLGQTQGRLTMDLALNAKRTWLHVPGPGGGGGASARKAKQEASIRTIQSALDEWSIPDAESEDRRTVVVTVMKHAGNLRTLAGMLEGLRLPYAPVLIIDDEADQASLDGNAGSAARPDPTATFSAIDDLRRSVSDKASHTFLQYTATPQANLLIDIDDSLSPSFVQILEPGAAYVGGRELFLERGKDHLRTIPFDEVDKAMEADEGPPKSLYDALGSFLVGIAADYESGFAREDKANRSMLVHPSRLTDDHARLRRWVEAMVSDWKDLLGPDAERDMPEERKAFLEDLEAAHADLASTDPDLPAFDTIVSHMARALRKVEILELNKGAPPVPWAQHFAFVLIGGQAIERGFTVEGLTTTHLARSRGQGLADAIQQRARFFGYKRGYLGRVRIWIDDCTRQDFAGYARHEQDLRSRLDPIAQDGRPLRDWRREFLLDPTMRPTRRNVLARAVKQRKLSDDWLRMDRPALSGADLDANRSLLAHVEATISMTEDDGHDERTTEQRHLTSGLVPISGLLALLADVRLPFDDQRSALYGAMLQIDAYAAENGANQPSRVYLMSKGKLRERKIEGGKVAALFQGSNSRGGVMTYPGDQGVKVVDEPALQIHVLRSGDGTYKDVPAFALWIPASYAVGTLVQSDN